MFPFDVLSPLINKVLDFIPDPTKKAEAQLAAQKFAADHETEILKTLMASDMAQAEINKIEAQSESKFKSYWRPAFGWVGVAGFTWYTVLQPIIVFITIMYTGKEPLTPHIQVELLQTLCFGILGLGAYRSYEKKNGVN